MMRKVIKEQMKQENTGKPAGQQPEFQDLSFRYFTSISHEFRTPLTLILDPLEKFMERNIPPSGDQLRLMYKNAERLKRLVTQILDLRKMEVGNLKFEMKLEPGGLPVASMDEAFLKKAMEVVETHLENSEFGADLFASEMCMSRVHLYRKLKALTDMSVSDFVKNARLKLASDLIRDNKLTIKETAYTVGFKDPKYFSKCFKQQFGVRPSEYQGGMDN